jgi:lipoate-protein ligase A
VDVCRRKSGGGCVYSDSGNQMISCILRDTNAQRAFGYYLERLVDNLSALGLPAVTSTHNDVMIGDRKVSGNASFARPTATIVHGTLLWKSNMDDLTAAITPSEAKLAKHAVQSVRQRVTNLWDMGIRDLSALQQHLISRFSQPSGRTVTLTEADVRVIEQIETTYVL